MTNTNMVSAPIQITDVNAVFTAIEKWIKQRPGLDFRNYGELAPYRAELRNITKDKARAMKALDEARGLQPQKPEILADAFRAFSGRLQWCPAIPVCDWCPTGAPARLEYTTGQYFPTEYRKAAASVLETYIAGWHKWYASEHPQEFTYHTIEDVKAANRQIGHHWFERSTLRFFNTKIESGLIGGKYFITSERMDEDHRKGYSVRRAEPDGTIETVGEFQQYDNRDEAREAIRLLVK